ncbi:extended synaptotagmin-3 [Ambystoma mexicanum]|uniref:extended synaptotagmin-3 n=1 Tax=Ambystoma mexicanum TaxID=8296 RepID=UPI0037E85BE0
MNPGPQQEQQQRSPSKLGPPKEKDYSPNAVNLLLLEMLSYLCRAVFYLVPVYLAGYLGLGLSWVLIGLLLLMWFRKNKSGKLARLSAACEVLYDEKLAISSHIGTHQLPAWVNFPDVERVEWLNKILAQAWPYFGTYVEKMLQEKVVPIIRASNIHLSAFTFTKIDLGRNCPKVNGIKAYTKEVDKREVMLDVQLCYVGNCEINVEVKKLCKAGVKGMQIHGTLRVVLAPLLSEAPFVGAVTMFFIQRPHLEINWTGLTNLLEIPGVNDMSDTMLVDLIASHLVLPNRFSFPLMSQVNVAQLRFPLPRGVLRVNLIEAEKLVPKDNYLKGIIKGKSDPYAVARVGNQKFRSKTIKENLNPTWNEKFEFVVHEVPGQDLEMDFYDEDPDKDDFLGSLLICLEGVMKDRVVDEWFPLSDIESGQVHLKLEWQSLVANPDKLIETKGQAAAMVIVYLDSAFNLPKHHFEYSNSEYGARKLKNSYVKKTDKDPNSYVLLCVGNKNMKSKICCLSQNPVWEEAFAFFIQDVHSQHLRLEVKDDERQCALGMLTIPLNRLLKDTDMTLDQRFHLENSGPNSFVKMKIVLRVLCIEEPDSDSIYTGINALKRGPVPIKKKPKNEKDNTKPQKANQNPKTSTSSQDFLVPKDRKPSDSASEVFASEKAVETKPLANSGTRTPLAQMTPNLRHLKIIGPSMASLNSFASTCFDANEGELADRINLEGVCMGEIQLTARYASLRQCLIITVNACRNLLQSSSSGPDPYVRMYLLPDKRWSGRKRTTVKRKTLHPQYEEKFEFFVSLEDVKRRSLDIAVKNNRSFVSQQRKELGKVLVDLSREDLAKGFTEWFELTVDGKPRS